MRSAVPSGTLSNFSSLPRTGVLGYFQPSLPGLSRIFQVYPGLPFWAIFSRPFRDSLEFFKSTQDWRLGLLSAVPSGTLSNFSSLPRTGVLGYFQPSLPGLSRIFQVYPGLASWTTFSRPFRDSLEFFKSTQDWRLGLLSAVPSGTLSSFLV